MSSLTIKDIAHTEELSAKALSAVRGGSNYNFGNANVAYGGGFASPGVVVAPVTQTDTYTKVEIPTIQNINDLQQTKTREKRRRETHRHRMPFHPIEVRSPRLHVEPHS